MKHVAILLAGGSGERMGQSVTDKILVEIGGMPLFQHLIRTIKISQTQDALIIVVRDNDQRKKLSKIMSKEDDGTPVFYTIGGKERQDSVRSGLEMVPTGSEWVTVHDCARAAVSSSAWKDVRKTLLKMNCAVSLAHRVTDTIRHFENAPLEAPDKGTLLSRSNLWAMETPQAFPRDLLERAHNQLKEPVTDDLAAVEALGEPIVLVESLKPNPKLTRPADLYLLENILTQKNMETSTTPNIRVGFGYDIHQLKEGRPLVLGGIHIQSEKGLLGHSDADVLSHAIADAILGACGLSDIGHYFPNNDPDIEGISSQKILRKASREASKAGFKLVNIDSTLIAEEPKVSPYLDRMKSQLSQTLDLPVTAIGIKATTQERIGAIGQGAGIAAHAVVSMIGK